MPTRAMGELLPSLGFDSADTSVGIPIEAFSSFVLDMGMGLGGGKGYMKGYWGKGIHAISVRIVLKRF